jgi:hypothetical protein
VPLDFWIQAGVGAPLELAQAIVIISGFYSAYPEAIIQDAQIGKKISESALHRALQTFVVALNSNFKGKSRQENPTLPTLLKHLPHRQHHRSTDDRENIAVCAKCTPQSAGLDLAAGAC